MINFIDMIEKHKFVLPSSKKEIILRPILIKEEKVLLMSKDTDERIDMIEAVSQILTNCTMNDINWEEMSYADFCYAFIQLRKISKGETVNMGLYCQNENCDKKGHLYKKSLNIDEIISIKNKDKKMVGKVNITEDVAVVLETMKTKFIKKLIKENLMKKDNVLLIHYEMIKKHIVSIIKGEENFSEFNEDEDDLDTFLDSLNKEQFTKLYKWFLDEPKPDVFIKWECPFCKTENIVQEVDIINFFELL